ncbi:MAG: hypothetical protein GY703_06375 [Gammaproteobacteria bacterium]|nr:hypothetical protein [Gammaproteobacteria bacterium]
MEKRRCAACRKLFHPRPQSPEQKFCSASECQRERKRRWQRARRATDPDYRDNDVQANRQWRSRHPGYWRAYRCRHPELVIRNRDKQRERDRARRLKAPQPPPTSHLANEDASTLSFFLETGTYRMIPVTGEDLANEDACLVKIALVSGG